MFHECKQPFSRVQGWSKAYGQDDEPSTAQTVHLSGSKVNAGVLYFPQTKLCNTHGTATPLQLSTKCIGTETRFSLTEGGRTKNVQLDPFVRPALVTAGYVAEGAFPRYCVLTDNGNLLEHLQLSR